jgi:dephospho-CoA kinase
MKIIGLSGGIASGKNFIADIFAKKGAAVFDADAEAHQLLKSDKSTINEVKKNFPKSFVSERIDRKTLGEIVFSDEKKLKILEKIIHPKIRENYKKFLKKAKKEDKKIIVLNIPLLLESKEYKCDHILSILIPTSIQRKRFLARAKKSNPENFAKERDKLIEKFDQIRKKQIKNSERKRLGDFVIKSGLSKSKTISQVEDIIRSIL